MNLKCMYMSTFGINRNVKSKQRKPKRHVWLPKKQKKKHELNVRQNDKKQQKKKRKKKKNGE